MEKTNKECSVDWDERMIHENILAKIEGVRGYMHSCVCDYGHSEVWRVDTLSSEDLYKIMSRGREDEILPLIHRYGQATPPNRWITGCTSCHTKPTEEHILPEEIQQLIAQRNNPQEMEAYVSYQGFGKLGQDVILDRGDHAEIMRYLERHGLLPEQQEKLLERGDKDEICLHISRHGLAEHLLNHIFDMIENSNNMQLFYSYINRCELPVPFQLKMIKLVDSEAFRTYIDRYGLWNETHVAMITERSEDDIICYLKRHRYLVPEAEEAMVNRKLMRLNIFHAHHRVNIDDENFLFAMLKQKPYDQTAVNSVFLKMNFADEQRYNKIDIDTMRFGSVSMKKERIEKGPLDLKALSYLFFRDKTGLFDFYLDRWVRKP